MTAQSNAGQALADQIERSIREEDLGGGTVVGSEPEVRDRHGAGPAVFRQAMRILEHRGIARLQRGQGGGVLVLGRQDEAIARSLAPLIESRLSRPNDIWALARAADQEVYLRGAHRVSLSDCVRLRELVRTLEAMSQAEFTHVLGHRKLQAAVLGALAGGAALLAQRVVFEMSIDLFPAHLHLAGESLRREFWILSLNVVDALIANDVTALMTARRHQLAMMSAAFDYGEPMQMSQFGRRVGPIEGIAAVSHGTRADFLVREILDEIRRRDWCEGERLGTAAELIERYGISLPVLRQAVRVLQENGAVRVSRGRGGGFEIGALSSSAMFARASAYLRSFGTPNAGSAAFLVDLLCVALEQVAARSNAEQIGQLRETVIATSSAFDPEDASTRILCASIAEASGNAPLIVFVNLLLNTYDQPAATRQPPASSSGPLGAMIDALGRGDSGIARRAFLEHVNAE